MKRLYTAFLLLLCICRTASAAWGAHYDPDALPEVPPGFKAMFVAREPELSHEICMCFDAQGRLFVAGGPQFRLPKENTPKDKIKILIQDKDGKATQVKVFAEGFNCIQAIAWKGNDLWVCHAPDVTICRATNGGDEADEFIDVFTGLGPLRHGLHGFNWAPDGKLYMSQGNNTCTKDAPKAWRDLMHVESNAPDVQPLRKYTKAEWKSHYLKPHNDESEGGILRCDPDGQNLEIWARGMRNPWDIGFDDQFNWVSGDNDDGPEHDRVFSPFYGSHYGKRHAWSYSWTGEDNPCTVPISTLFANASGSAVGVVFNMSEQFPSKYRNCFFMGDSDGEKVYYFHPEWTGAQMKIKLETFAWTKKIGGSALFLPTDVEVGPDGALYVVGWGSTYGSIHAPYYKGDDKARINEGRVFRIWNENAPLTPREAWLPPKRTKRYAEWSFAELMEDMGHQIPVWRVNAQDEFVRRGAAVRDELLAALNSGKLTTAQETWTVWALGRIEPGSADHNKIFQSFLESKNLNLRIQAIRILASRKAMEYSSKLAANMSDPEARIRLESALALWHMGAKDQVAALQNAAVTEKDRICYYTQWRGMQELLTPGAIKPLLKDERAGLRGAALLALMETRSLAAIEVLPFVMDKDPAIRKTAVLWISKAGKDLPADELLKMLASTDAATRSAGLVCLTRTKLNPEDKAKLEAFHANAKGEERAAALKALYTDPASLPLLWTELNNSDVNVQQAATEGLLKHKKEAPEFIFPKLGSASPAQRDAALVVLATQKDLTWSPSETDAKAIQQAFVSSRELLTRRSAVEVLVKIKKIEKSPGVKLLGEVAQKAASDSDAEISASGTKLCNKLHLEIKPREKIPGASVEEILSMLEKADVKRGHELFFRTNTPGCYNCHQLENIGTAVGPDLADIGLRGDAKYIAESIVDPNKVIIEGFQPSTLKLHDGRVLTGLIKEESDETLTLSELGGKHTIIEKKDIASRKTLNVSYMPEGFGEMLKPAEIADMVAFLLTMKAEKGKAPQKGPADGD